MEKLVYLAWKTEGEAPTDFRKWLLDVCAPQLLRAGAQRLSLEVGDLAGTAGMPAERVLGRGGALSAVVSLWLHSLDARGPLEATLRAGGAAVAGYLVTESVPQARADRGWPDGERSPGVTQFSAFPKPERLSEEAFYRGWHERHTPFSFELHPRRWEYVRNAVARRLTPEGPPYRALVQERFRSLEDFTDPKRYFGSTDAMRRAAADLQEYADFAQLDSAPMSEYILSS